MGEEITWVSLSITLMGVELISIRGEHAQLARFEGKPGDLSPKARLHLWAGKILPSMFNSEPPFDRHDWIVTRPDPNGTAEAITPTAAAAYINNITNSQSATPSQSSPASPPAPSPFAAATRTSTTRYVIDYYDAGKDEEGMPVFSLDVRPALDSFQSVSERIRVGFEEYMKGRNGAE
jgi:cytochrome c heme-lyase